jgi:hypothetical protein
MLEKQTKQLRQAAREVAVGLEEATNQPPEVVATAEVKIQAAKQPLTLR